MWTLESHRGQLTRGMALALVALICVCTSCLALTGCDPNIDESGIEVDSSGAVSNEEQARRRVSALFDTLKDPDEDTLNAYIAKLSNDQRLAIDLVRLNGVDIPDLCRQLFADVSCEIGDVTVDGDQATVALRIDHKPYGALANTTNQQFSELLASDEGTRLKGEGIPALLGRYETLYLDNLNSCKDSVSDAVSVGLEQKNGGWTITSDSLQDIAATLVAGVDLEYGQ